MKHSIEHFDIIINTNHVLLNDGSQEVLVTNDDFYREQFKLLISVIILTKTDYNTIELFLKAIDLLDLDQYVCDIMKSMFLSAHKKLY